MGMVAFWAAGTLSRVYDPLFLGWLNQNVRSEVRATVLSMSSQADSFGQISGGPVIGAIGSLVSLRAALAATAAAMLPLLVLYTRAFRIKGGDGDGGGAAAVEVPVESAGGGAQG
jgi:DHA3 family tetracycline resistance protein-like MFS transporter